MFGLSQVIIESSQGTRIQPSTRNAELPQSRPTVSAPVPHPYLQCILLVIPNPVATAPNSRGVSTCSGKCGSGMGIRPPQSQCTFWVGGTHVCEVRHEVNIITRECTRLRADLTAWHARGRRNGPGACENTITAPVACIEI